MRVYANYTAKLIKDRMKELKLTQQMLSVRMGFSNKNAQYVSNLTRSKCPFPPKHVNKLAMALSLSRNLILEAMVQDYKEALLKEVEL